MRKWLGSTQRKLIEDKGYFNRFVCTDWFWHHRLVSNGKNVLSPCTERTSFSHAYFMAGFLGRKEICQRVLPATAVSLVLSSQNN